MSGPNDFLLPGTWNCICDRCGFKFKATDIRQEWTGLMVCADCWEPRHPQDFIRTTPDRMDVPFTRPVPAIVYANPESGGGTSLVNQQLINGFLLNG